MFQSFEEISHPEDGSPRLAALRAVMSEHGLQGFLVPRADAHQGEYVADCDARLAWLTGFTGSAGFAAVLPDIAGVFVDGRYRVQVRSQVETNHFTPVDWPETKLADWLKAQCNGETAIGFDPWLHTTGEIETVRDALNGTKITLVKSANLVDTIWEGRPPAPTEPATLYPDAFAGLTQSEKRQQLSTTLKGAGQDAAVLTLPDSICWLLNIRGADIPRIPILQGFAILHADASVDIFAASGKLDTVLPSLRPDVRAHDVSAFSPALRALTGRVRVDKASAPLAVSTELEQGAAEVAFERDPCLLPKACKTDAEIDGARSAHQRDAAAIVEFLCWVDTRADELASDAETSLSEIDVVRALEGFRRATNQLRDISFETIAGSGPHGAVIHYRVTEATDRQVQPGELLLVDSGGQYEDGTTDITRTIAIGTPGEEERACFTRVLQGMIAMSRVRWPQGVSGRDLDALARYPLWLAGQDYDHGTGHGVGCYLSVHEGPQRLSRLSGEPLLPGMILSNEPGYYREGHFGIRLENLIVVQSADPLPKGDAQREMLAFETLTYVPIDLRLVIEDWLGEGDRAWLNAYHAETFRRLAPHLSPAARDWLSDATRAI